MGDSAIVENVHKEAKASGLQTGVRQISLVSSELLWSGIGRYAYLPEDSLRDARHFQKSRVVKMQQVIRSGVYKSRKMESLTVTDEEKVLCSAGVSAAAFNPMTHPNTHAPR